MNIEQLTVDGYRSLKHVQWKPGALNVVIGPNGSGKTNLLRLLELFSISARGGLSQCIQRAGGITPLVWNDWDEGIVFLISVPITPNIIYDNPIKCNYLIDLKPLSKTSYYRIKQESLYWIINDIRSEMLIDCFQDVVRFQLSDGKEIDFPLKKIENEETILSLMGSPLVDNQDIRVFHDYLSSWRIYHDVDVSQKSVLRQPAIARTEKRVSESGENLVQVLHTLYNGDREFKNDLNLAMRAAFGTDYEELVFLTPADGRIQLYIRWKSLRREQSSFDLSDGTLRFLFLIAVLLSPDPPSLIAIDEPETGLHPSMLPIIAEHAVEASRRTQIVFTTHSPQFFDAFTDTQPTTTVTTWEDGQTQLKVLDEDELRHWLKEYTLGSLYRTGELEGMA